MPVDPTRSRNPLQKLQGYIERGGAPVTTTEPSPRLIKTQELLPNKDVRLVFPGTDDSAPMYDRDGTRIAAERVTADDKAFYSFYAETGQYDIRFTEPNTNPPTQIFRLSDVKVESLIYNVRDYGAKGNGVDDDTLAIQAAIDEMIAAHSTITGVGTLFFPNGRYLVSRQVTGSPFIFNLPSGIIIQGTAGPYTGTAPDNCQLVLTSSDCSIFRIGSDRHKLMFRDIGMTTDVLNNADTIAIDMRATEDQFATTSSSNIEFENVTIWKFDRGISIEGSGTELQWDITGVRINHCIIVECRYAVYVNSQNCDFMKIMDSRIGANTLGFGIHLEKVGIITLDSILGAGQIDREGTKSDTFINLTAARGNVTIINCECEGFDNSIKVTPLSVGNISWPILLLNCTLGPTVQLSSQCEVVSIASRFLPDTVQCDPNVEVMFFSFGDSIIGLDKVPDPSADFHLNGSSSRLVSRANRYRVDFQRPARFGGHAGQIAPRLVNTPLAASQFESGDAQVALCDPAGNVIFHVRAEEGFLYFENSDHERLMRLDDKDGNLVVKGTVTPEGMP